MDYSKRPTAILHDALMIERLNVNRFAELGPDRVLSRKRMIDSFRIEKEIEAELLSRLFEKPSDDLDDREDPDEWEPFE